MCCQEDFLSRIKVAQSLAELGYLLAFGIQKAATGRISLLLTHLNGVFEPGVVQFCR
jgi:hypothetical protein